MRALPQSSQLQGKKRVYADIMDEKEAAITIIKGKGKARDLSSPLPTPIRKPRRAETRPCPVCDEAIPLRLMGLHAQLESERVDQIIGQIGSTEPLLLVDELNNLSAPGPSTSRNRRSALKALKSFTSTPSPTTNNQLAKTIQTIQRHRKQRFARFKEMAREEEEGYPERPRWQRSNDLTGDEIICPVCSGAVRGDQEVINGHVDACLVDESRKLEENRARSNTQDLVVVDGDWDILDTTFPDGAVGHVGNVMGIFHPPSSLSKGADIAEGTGFHTRDPTSRDVDDDIDIDGDDQETYGEAQFTEGDIVAVDRNDPLGDLSDTQGDVDSSDEAGSGQVTLQDLVAGARAIQHRAPNDMSRKELRVAAVQEKADEVLDANDLTAIDQAILGAKSQRSKKAVITALEGKIEHLESMRSAPSAALSLCRICLDPYSEPTVSTGCWHTCCRGCWLQCLGSTKLCPICKRITGATDLRRIYL